MGQKAAAMDHALARLIGDRKAALGNLSDRQIAERSGKLGNAQVSRWQREPVKALPDADSIDALALALEVSRELVFNAAVESVAEERGYNIKTMIGQWAAEIGSRAESLTPEDRRMLEGLITRLERDERRKRRH